MPSYISAQGYALVIDNVGKDVMTRHQGGLDETKPRQVNVWTMAYAVKNRVNGGSYEDEYDESNAFTSELHGTACAQSMVDFLPRQEDYLERLKRFTILIQRILKQHMAAFSECHVTEHIQHKHSTELRKKSETAVVGVIQENPGTTDGMTKVTNHLQNFVPYPNGRQQQPVVIPVHGDAATVLQLNKAMCSRQLAPLNKNRLNGIWPVPPSNDLPTGCI